MPTLSNSFEMALRRSTVGSHTPVTYPPVGTRGNLHVERLIANKTISCRCEKEGEDFSTTIVEEAVLIAFHEMSTETWVEDGP